MCSWSAASLANLPETGVRKTSFCLPQRVMEHEKVLVVTPTTVARTQAVTVVLGVRPSAVRVIGHQKCTAQEAALTLDSLVAIELEPLAIEVGSLSDRVNAELLAWHQGQPHSVAEAHRRLVRARESAEEAIAPAKEKVLQERGVVCATLGSLLGGSAVLPSDIGCLAVDEAGVVPAADFAFLLLSLAPFLSPTCPLLRRLLTTVAGTHICCYSQEPNF